MSWASSNSYRFVEQHEWESCNSHRQGRRLCHGDRDLGDGDPDLEVTVLTSGAGPNVAALTVGTGPVAYANGVLTSVQICATGPPPTAPLSIAFWSTPAQSGSGLATATPNIALTPVTYSDGSALNECVQFLDGSFLWGTVSQATINIGGEAATGLPVQVIANPTGFSIPTACSNGGTMKTRKRL